MSDLHGHRDRSGDWSWESRAGTAVSRFSSSPMAWLAAAAFLFVFAWAVAGNSLSFDNASLDSWCGYSASKGTDGSEGDVQAETCSNPCAHSASDVAVETSCNDYCPSGDDITAATRNCNPCDGANAATGNNNCGGCPETGGSDCNPCPEAGNSDCDPCAGISSETYNKTPSPTPDCTTPTPPVETPTPVVDCAKESRVDLTDPSVPGSSDEYDYEVDACGVTYVKFMGCWTADDVDHVETSAGTIEVLADGKIKISGLTDGDFPLDVTIFFTRDFPSGTGSVNTWLFKGPADSDGDSIWVDGPICIPVTDTPSPTPTDPPTDTPSPTPTDPPTDTPSPTPTETPTDPPTPTPTDPPTNTPTTPPTPETDLTIVKTDQPDPVQPRGTLSYSITVNNISDVDAENVVMTDALPAGVTLISATPSQGSCTGAVCNLGTIPAHQAVAISVVVTLDAGAPALLTNVACVATSTTETNLSNNCDDEETKVPTPTPLGATSTPVGPSNFPPTGGFPGATSATGQAAIAAAAAMLLFGLAAGMAARRKMVEVEARND